MALAQIKTPWDKIFQITGIKRSTAVDILNHAKARNAAKIAKDPNAAGMPLFSEVFVAPTIGKTGKVGEAIDENKED